MDKTKALNLSEKLISGMFREQRNWFGGGGAEAELALSAADNLRKLHSLQEALQVVGGDKHRNAALHVALGHITESKCQC